MTAARLLAVADRQWSRLEDACAVLAAVVIAGFMVLTVVEVIGRKLFNAPVPGIVDLFDLGMAAAALFGAAACQRLDGHVRMELAVRHLKGRVLWAVEGLTLAAALAFIVIIVISATDNAWRAYDFGDATMDLLLPVWPSKAVVPVALAVLAGRLLLGLLDCLRLLITPDAEPVTVPRVASVADHARAEIEEAFGEDGASR